VTTILVKAKY